MTAYQIKENDNGTYSVIHCDAGYLYSFYQKEKAIEWTEGKTVAINEFVK